MNMIANGPARIAAMKAALAELKRHERYMEDALRSSNDEAHHRYFDPLLKLLRLIISNEAEGNSQFLADDLYNFRGALRRFKLPDIDPMFATPTPALHNLRGARGNLLEAVETALEAAQDLGLVPSQQQGALVFRQSIEVSELLVRLDERLRGVEDNLDDMKQAALAADNQAGKINQVGLINLNISAMTCELTAARFETKVASDISLGTGGDLSVLARSIENLAILASDLSEKTKAFAEMMTASVKVAALAAVRGATRVRQGFATVVSAVRRKLQPESAAPGALATPLELPLDFDLARTHKMILEGNAPPAEWRLFNVALNFSHGPLKHLAPLARSTALQSLELSHTQISDLTPLAEMSALQNLDISHTEVSDLKPLADMTALQNLNFSSTKVKDIAALASVPSLLALSFSYTLVSELAPLAKMTLLTSLDLSGTQVRDLVPLAKIATLLSLDFSYTQVSDLEPLAKMTALTSLDCSGTQVRDLTPLANVPSLMDLNFSGTRVSSLGPLAKMTALKSLDFSGTQVRDLVPLAKIATLLSLDFAYTQVSDLEPLAKMTALTSLDCSGTQVRDLTPLANMTALADFSISNTQVSDLTPLAKMTSLTNLRFTGSQILDLTPLAKLTALTDITMLNTQVRDLTPLVEIPSLRYIWVREAQQADFALRFPALTDKLRGL